ncbi:MAG: M42 family metallopeptidase, partial [Halobacteriota archaeon]
MNFDFDLLAELTEASGVPGYEDEVRDIVRRELEATTDRVRTDDMGNVVGTIDAGEDETGATSSDYEVAVAAHMDEIGFMVKHVTDEGFLHVDALGGWDPRVLRAQRVTVHTDHGDLTGVIGAYNPRYFIDAL